MSSEIHNEESEIWKEGFRLGVTQGDMQGTIVFEHCAIFPDETITELHNAHILEEGRLYGYAFGYETALKGAYETRDDFDSIVYDEYTADIVKNDGE